VLSVTQTFVAHFLEVLTFSSDIEKKGRTVFDLYATITDAALTEAKQNIFE